MVKEGSGGGGKDLLAASLRRFLLNVYKQKLLHIKEIRLHYCSTFGPSRFIDKVYIDGSYLNFEPSNYSLGDRSITNESLYYGYVTVYDSQLSETVSFLIVSFVNMMAHL